MCTVKDDEAAECSGRRDYSCPVTQIDVLQLIDEVETAWIPLADGRRLAARLFLPKTCWSRPAPVVLEYIPYRRRDGTRQGDEAMHRWFAAHGYACARVDIAGMGDSDGSIDDEYVQREQDDGLEVIAWLGRQPWSSGAVGIIGISWGGFNGLQIAARRPPALRAVISLCSTTDRFHGDAHFTGGCLNEENLEWGGCFFTMSGFPPDPAIVGHDRWREMWRHRLEQATLHPADWLEHQRRDDFWRHGSVIEDYAAIQVPVLAVSGWADGYTGTVFDLVEGLGGHTRGIVGPWGHKYPHDGVPGPAIGFLQEASRWWDRWLAGDPSIASDPSIAGDPSSADGAGEARVMVVDSAVDDDPVMRLYLQQSHRPMSHIADRSGSWIGFNSWSPHSRTATEFRLREGLLEEVALMGDQSPSVTAAHRTVSSPQTTGLAGGQWCAYGQGKIAPELALDQREDDAGSLVYDSSVLERAVHIVGRAQVALRVAADKPAAFIAVRLCDVHPDGSVERLSYGILNLCHRDSHEFPQHLEPGTFYDVAVTLKPIAQTLPAGHRLRLSLSTSYWPMIWPSPDAATVKFDEAYCHVIVPTPTDFVALAGDVFGPAETAQPGGITEVREGSESRQGIRDLGAQRTDFVAERDDGVYRIDDIGTEVSFTRRRASSIVDHEPLSATASYASTATFRRGDWDVRVESEIVMTCDAEVFYLHGRLATFDNGELFIERHFDRVVARDYL